MKTLEQWTTGIILTIGLAMLTVPIQAQERYDDEPLPERFEIGIGGFLMSSFDTTFRLDSTQVPIGTVIDLEDTLNVDSSTSVLRVDGSYRFNKKSRINFGWFSSNRDGLTEVQEDITLGDPDTGEEIVIEAGASVTSAWDFDVFNVTYTWSFVNTWRYELYIGGGLNIRDLKIDLEGDFDLSGNTVNETVEASGLIPLPVGVFGARYNFSRKWRADFRKEWLRIELGDYKGTIGDTLLVFQHDTFKNVGFAFGLNVFDLDIEAEGDDFRGELESNYHGFLFYVKVYTGKNKARKPRS